MASSKKEKDSSSSKKEKDSSKKKKEKKSKKDKKEKEDDSSPAVAPTTKPTPPSVIKNERIAPQQIFEATQLLLRYDRSRTGQLNKKDFQRLIEDVNGRVVWGDSRIRPVTLTESSAIPLGLERTTANSQFEAGQLFERYDGDKCGLLDMNHFQRFYYDFRAQLSPFFHQLPFQADPRDGAQGATGAGTHGNTRDEESYRRLDVLSHSEDQSKKLLRGSSGQTVTEELYHSRWQQIQCMSTYWYSERHDDTVQHIHNEQQAQVLRSYKTNSIDTKKNEEKLENLKSNVQRMARIRHNTETTSIPEMERFLDDYSSTYSFVHRMLDMRFPFKEAPSSLNITEQEEYVHGHKDTFPGRSQEPEEAKWIQKYDQAVHLLKVKDQIIWDLLQERDEYKHTSSDLENKVHEIRQSSAEEMAEWANLTDAMVEELERLRPHDAAP